MSEQQFDEHNPPTHWHLLLELRVMAEKLNNVNLAINAALETHNTLKKDIEALKIRVAQGVILAAALAVVLPLIINMTNPKIHFQTSPISQPR